MGYKESVGQAYLDRIKFAPKDALDIQLEVYGRYDREEAWVQAVIAQVDNIAGPLVIRELEEIKQEVIKALDVREWARLDKELRARPDAATPEVDGLRKRIEEKVGPLVMQTFHRITETKGPEELTHIETEAYARNGHPLKEADIADLFECSSFSRVALEIEAEEKKLMAKAESKLGQIYYEKLAVALEFADLKKLHIEASQDTRLSESEKSKIIGAINQKTVVASIKVNHEQMDRKETIATLQALELVAHTNPDILLPEQLGEVSMEIFRVTRLKLGFAGMKEKFPEISAHLISVEADYKKKVDEYIADQKRKNPDEEVGDMMKGGTLPQISRGRGMPASLEEIAGQIVLYHNQKAMVKAYEEAVAEQQRLAEEAKARGEEVDVDILSIGGGPRPLGAPMPHKPAAPVPPAKKNGGRKP